MRIAACIDVLVETVPVKQYKPRLDLLPYRMSFQAAFGLFDNCHRVAASRWLDLQVQM